MPPIIMYRERIARMIRTRLSRAQFNELEVSIPTRSLADCITIMSEFEFSVHTPRHLSDPRKRDITEFDSWAEFALYSAARDKHSWTMTNAEGCQAARGGACYWYH